ncbi:MAG: phosphopantetheine-binding protein, partial [Bacteroidota bacterium]
KEKLPKYMLPSALVEVEAFVLTPNGKIDRKALPIPENELLTVYVAPRNEQEGQLVEIWQQLLGKERIGIYDNFFESGGHSLLATRMTTAIMDALSINIPLKIVFQYPCIADLSKYIKATHQGKEELSQEEIKTIEI